MRRVLLALLVLASAAFAEEEARPRWGRLRLVSPVPVDSLAWHEALDLEGRYLDEAPLEPALVRALQILADRGYAFAEARPGSFDMDDRNTVTGVITLEPGVVARVEGVVLDGARVTKPGTAERLARVRAGDVYTGREGTRAKEQLARSGLFSFVGEPELVPGVEEDAVILKLPVEEPPYTRFSGLLGVSGPESNVTGFLDLDLRNIAGTAREASGRWENRGGGLTRYALRYREPWIPFIPMGVTGSLGHDVLEETYSYTAWEIVGDLSWDAWSFRFGRGGTRAVETLIVEEAGSDRNIDESFFVAGVTLDERDSSVNPAAGYLLGVTNRRGTKTSTVSGDTLEVRVDRNRWEASAEGYLELGSKWLLAHGSRFQFLDTPEDSLPRWDLYGVGGALSVRGYREEQFLTRAAWTFRNEVRFVQDRRGSALYGLVDVGFLNEEGTRLKDLFDTFLLGTGVGVRQGSKLGILGVEYAVAKGEGVLDGRIHVRVDAVF